MGKMAYLPAYFSYRRTLAGLSDEEAGRVFRAALAYAEDGTVPELSPVEMMGFGFIREDIDRANARYEEKCAKLSQNAQERWDRIRGAGDMQKDAIASKSMQKDAIDTKATETAKAKEKENAIETATSTGAGGSRTVGGTEGRKSGFVIPSMADVAGYCVKQGYTHVDVEEFCQFYDANGWTVGDGEPMKNWKAVLRGWEERAKNKPEPRLAETSFDTEDFFDAALQRTYGENWRFFKEGGEQG